MIIAITSPVKRILYRCPINTPAAIGKARNNISSQNPACNEIASPVYHGKIDAR